MVGGMLKARAVVERYKISHVKTVVVGASNLTKEVAEQLRDLIPGCNLLQGYGLTETTVAVTFESPLDHMFGSCGNLFPGCEGRLLDTEGNDITEHGRPGELLIRAPSVMLGYYNNDAATKDMLNDDARLQVEYDASNRRQ